MVVFAFDVLYKNSNQQMWVKGMPVYGGTCVLDALLYYTERMVGYIKPTEAMISLEAWEAIKTELGMRPYEWWLTVVVSYGLLKITSLVPEDSSACLLV